MDARLAPYKLALVCAATVALLLSACAVSPPESGEDSSAQPTFTPRAGSDRFQERPRAENLAQVENIEILILESFPVQVHVIARGQLADACTEIEQIDQQQDLDNMTFWVEVTTKRDPDLICAQALVPFEEVIALDVRDLPAGTYTVDVNGVRDTFTLDVDNKAP